MRYTCSGSMPLPRSMTTSMAVPARGHFARILKTRSYSGNLQGVSRPGVARLERRATPWASATGELLPIRLTEGLRNGARALLAQAIEAEVEALLSRQADKLTDDGRQRLVRHGHLPERELMTGIGVLRMRALECFGFSGNLKPSYGVHFGRRRGAILDPVLQRQVSPEGSWR